MLLKSITTPGGAQVAYHSVARIEAEVNDQGNMVVAHVRSWPSEINFIEHSGLHFTHVWYVVIPLAMLEPGDLFVSCEHALANNEFASNEFYGASVVPGASGLDAARARQWAMIKQTRSIVINMPIDVDGRRYDADTASRELILGAIEDLPEDTSPVEWTLEDNTVASITKADLVAVKAECKTRIYSAYGIARALRSQIFDPAKTTIEEITSIVWPTTS